MSGKPSGADSTREVAPSGVQVDPRRPELPSTYKSPKLVRFGTLIELTQSGNGTVGESAVAKTRKPRPQS